MDKVARHVRVTGRVQGVFFRAWTNEQAQSIGVSGWVRNCPDGRVEAHVEGDPEAVEKMIGKMRRGPPSAVVEDLRTWDVEPCDFDEFEVRH
jgi:acylphosphatase